MKTINLQVRLNTNHFGSFKIVRVTLILFVEESHSGVIEIGFNKRTRIKRNYYVRCL